MKKLNNYLFELRAKKFTETHARERRFVSYDKAKTVLLLFESDFSEKNLGIRKLISQLQQDGKKVSAWGFVNKKEIGTAILPEFRILHDKHTDFFEKPQTSFINELEAMEFSLVLDLTLNPILPLQYVVLYANAAFKVGVHKNDLPIYDFMLDLESLRELAALPESEESPIDETYLYNQIIFYLKSIQTND